MNEACVVARSIIEVLSQKTMGGFRSLIRRHTPCSPTRDSPHVAPQMLKMFRNLELHMKHESFLSELCQLQQFITASSLSSRSPS